MIRLPALLLLSVALALPAKASEIDGAWECRSFGALIATVGFAGGDYVLANAQGPSGRGSIGAASGSYDMFVVRTGPLLDALRIVGGRLSLDQDEPMLTLLRDTGEDLYCYR